MDGALVFLWSGIPGFFMPKLLSVNIGVSSAVERAFIGLTWMKTFQWKLSCLVFLPARVGNYSRHIELIFVQRRKKTHVFAHTNAVLCIMDHGH